MDVVTLKLSPRSVTGKKVKELRKSGQVPVHLYGRGIESQALQAEAHVLRRVLPQVGTNIPLSLELDAEGENICFVREIQRHPVTEEVLHVDFLRVDVSRAIQAEVPIALSGSSPPAVRELGGTLLQPLLSLLVDLRLSWTSLLVEALPMDVPASLQVDVSQLDDFEKGIFVRDIELDPAVTLVSDPDEMVARVSPPRLEVEDEPSAEDELDLEAEDEEEAAPSDEIEE